MNAAIDRALPDLHRWLRTKARLHQRDGGGHDGGEHAGGLPWADLFAPLPGPGTGVAWDDGIAAVRAAFAGYSPHLGGLVDRALAERWIDVEPRDAKRGGASCASFVDDRSLILLNWNGSADGVQTAAHELGHAYHNTQLAHRTMLQRRIPMALAETASIFCETLMVESGLASARAACDRDAELRLLDVDLQGTSTVVVDIRSRVLFETEVFARRERRTMGVRELDELMLECQAAAYGNGLATPGDPDGGGHPHMWVVKTHYYSSHFYNWPYTFGLLFGLGLFARYREAPERFRAGYDDLLARAGTSTAEELALLFDLDITGETFWEASLDVVRSRISRYAELARSSS
jgi:oligoendopeptidase F